MPRCTRAVQGDVVTVGVEGQVASTVAVALAPHSSEHAIASGLVAHIGARRLHVADPKLLWARFEDASVEAAFDHRFLSALGPWCCWQGPGGKHEMRYAEFYQRDDLHALALGA